MSTNPVTITAPDGLPFVDISREFDAPVEAVFHAYEDPALVAQWNGPDGYEVDIEEYALRTGGRYRFIHRNPAGDEFVFNGVFHSVAPNALIIQTFEFEGVPDVVSIESMAFEALEGGRTRISGRSTFPSVEARDGIVEAGMEHGVVEGYARLDALLAKGA
jgi:uncharacterized protein YndB with AHSA1/START domain